MEQYISKSALVVEIEKLINMIYAGRPFDSLSSEQQTSLWYVKSIMSSINFLEVKEVDLDADYIEEIYSHIDSIKETADRMTSGNFMHHRAAIKFSANTISKVLELIGLKAQKGEEV